MFMYCIYRITNKINGKTYIGQHKYKDLSQDKYMGSGKLINQAYSKYGIENFEREILVSEVETKTEIDEFEKRYIESERNLGHGEYNISDGGNSPSLSGKNSSNYGRRSIHDLDGNEKHIPKDNPLPDGYFEGRSELTRSRMSLSNSGKNWSDESKKKVSDKMSGINHPNYNKIFIHDSNGNHKFISRDSSIPKGYIKGRSKDSKDKQSKSITGKNNPFYGRHHSEDTRERISKSLMNHHHSDESKSKMSKSISEYQLGKKYYNNGLECHKYIPGKEPEGYKLGKLPK